MKIEIGESLFYSWLRHVKDCQIVQTNWKPSRSWALRNPDDLESLFNLANQHFEEQLGVVVSGGSTFRQFLHQGEIDVLGINYDEAETSKIYAIETSFHESGLQYGNKNTTVERIVKKILRAALSVKAFFPDMDGEIIFASPKVYQSQLDLIEPQIKNLNAFFVDNRINVSARIIANDDFNEKVLKPILLASHDVSDTSELFMRSHQLLKMFEPQWNLKNSPMTQARARSSQTQRLTAAEFIPTDSLAELKVGKIANILLRKALTDGLASPEEIRMLLTREYTKRTFGLTFPLLVEKFHEYEKIRYYVEPLTIHGSHYYLCSQWNYTHRPQLLSWLEGKDSSL